MATRKEFRLKYGKNEIVIETGWLAKQADGSVMITCGGTQVLTTACSARTAKDGQDFFPLTVDYREKFYAAGKFLGGFFKREARPSNREILTSRIIDRPLRPLFPEGYMAETTIQSCVHSYDGINDAEVLAGLSASAALVFSDIPFAEPVGFCKVGRIAGNLVLNPTQDQWKDSDLELVVAGSKNAILMVEGEGDEIPEADFLKAIMFGHSAIKEFCVFLENAAKEVAKTKRTFIPLTPNQGLMDNLEATFLGDIKKCLAIIPKGERSQATADLIQKVKEAFATTPEKFNLTASIDFGKEAAKSVDALMYKIMRNDILKESKRIGGRGLKEVRKIETEVGVLSKVHGSSLFTRGETQVLGAITIGGSEGEQMNDNIQGITYEKFYLHYTFAPYSVGEARSYRGVGRREVGHGNLAERALRKVLPDAEGFPYTIRVACEVLESNGSSSMGSVCAGSLALMDAGVPLKAPVAGVAMGLIMEGSNYKILTDILGDEDHLGDMDFKLAGTTKGVTAIQMDIKIAGISEQIFKEALTEAHAGRIHILSEMSKTMTTARSEFKEGVPTIMSTKIEKEEIGGLIGPGGKNIKGLQERFKVTIEVKEDGTVNVLGADKELLKQCMADINLMMKGPEIGAIYPATIVSIKEYGAFVDIPSGISGLVHVSEISDDRIQNVEEYLTVGDNVQVQVMSVDNFGRIKFSIKAVQPVKKKT